MDFNITLDITQFLCYNSLMYAEVSLTQGNFIYLLGDKFSWVPPGHPVLVPFRNTIRMGIVLNLLEGTTIKDVKPVKAVLYEEPILNEDLLSLSSLMADYYGMPQGVCMKLMLPPPIRERIIRGKPLKYESRQGTLSDVKSIPHQRIKEAISIGDFKRFLLYGKERMELYLSTVEYVLSRGMGAILLFPELASEDMKLIEQRFTGIVAVIHSRSRKQAFLWESMRRGSFRVCVGSMSAVFAPIPNLGVIIVDEEHSEVYKAVNRPYHNVRDVAIMRAKIKQIPCLIGSATPSFESFHNAKKGKYELIEVGKGEEIGFTVVDMSKERAILSKYLIESIKIRVEKKEKVVLFLPKKGYSLFCMCLDCGWIPYCPRCSITLTYYRGNHNLLCHHCGYQTSAPTVCKKCKGTRFVYPGTGTERLEKTIRAKLKSAKVMRMDTDILKSYNEYEKVYREFQENGDILLGTQLVIKGCLSSSVRFLGIVSCDALFSFPDFRARERLFSQIMKTKELIGDGEVVLQTYNPGDPLFRYIKENNYELFYSEEIKKRRKHKLPPFTHLIRIVSFSTRKKRAEETIQKIAERLKDSRYKFLGPSPCPLEKVKEIWRYHILVKADDPREFFQEMPLPKDVRVEVDPRDMM